MLVFASANSTCIAYRPSSMRTTLRHGNWSKNLGSAAKAYCAAISVWTGLGATKCCSPCSKPTGAANLISDNAAGAAGRSGRRREGPPQVAMTVGGPTRTEGSAQAALLCQQVR
jgi:hypothetical protein